MSMDKSVAIYWLKRDLRLRDNSALLTALRSHSTVVPIFVLEPSFIEAPETSVVHINAIFEALADLKKSLAASESELFIIYGEVKESFEKLHTRLPFGYIYAHEEIGNNRTFKRDLAVHKWARAKGVQFREMQQTGVVRKLHDRDEWAAQWRKFYFNAVNSIPHDRQLQKLRIPSVWRTLAQQFKLELCNFVSAKNFEELQTLNLQNVSESKALEDLYDFLYNRGIGYRGGISSPNTALTVGSRLSVHFAYGTISARQVYQAVNSRIAELKDSPDPTAKRWISSLVSFKSRLHWRDHFMQRLESEPTMEFEPLNLAYKNLGYTNDLERIEAFFVGQTGFPLVDAVMRCLYQTRFINFRMRAMITSFACHALHISWQILDARLAQLFLDYEPGIHLSQLQMQAGVVGINTVRTYNPIKQIIDQDAHCQFIKKWVPELRPYTPAEIIDHVNFPVNGYTKPIVDWKTSVAVMRKMIYQVRSLPNSKETSQAVFVKHGSRKKIEHLGMLVKQSRST